MLTLPEGYRLYLFIVLILCLHLLRTVNASNLTEVTVVLVLWDWLLPEGLDWRLAARVAYESEKTKTFLNKKRNCPKRSLPAYHYTCPKWYPHDQTYV